MIYYLTPYKNNGEFILENVLGDTLLHSLVHSDTRLAMLTGAH